MQTKTMIVLAVVAVLTASAIGVAYAYSSQTANSANDVDNRYVTILQDEITGQYANDIIWNSEQTEEEKVAFWTDGGVYKTGDNAGKRFPITEDLTGEVDAVLLGSSQMTLTSTHAFDAFTFQVTPGSENAALNFTDFKYYVKITCLSATKIQNTNAQGTELGTNSAVLELVESGITFYITDTYTVGTPQTITVELYVEATSQDDPIEVGTPYQPPEVNAVEPVEDDATKNGFSLIFKAVVAIEDA